MNRRRIENGQIVTSQQKSRMISNQTTVLIIYGNEINRKIYINSNVNNNVESELYSDDDISINSDKFDINIMITDEQMA
jgi:hypothetical protein